jgi:carbon monoxide dehydrogenase subunit G
MVTTLSLYSLVINGLYLRQICSKPHTYAIRGRGGGGGGVKKGKTKGKVRIKRRGKIAGEWKSKGKVNVKWEEDICKKGACI